MSKVEKNKVLKVIVLIVIVILIGVLIYLLNPKTMITSKLNNINEIGKMPDNEVFPKNLFSVFSSYTGSVAIEVAAKDFNYYAVDGIPNYYKKCMNMTNEQLSEYYNKKSEMIRLELGIESVEDFISLMNEIIKLEGQKLELTSYETIIGTTSVNNNIAKGCVKFIYNENQELYLNYLLKSDNFVDEHPVVLSSGVDIVKVKEQELKNEEELRNAENDIEGAIDLPGRVQN